MSKIPSKSSLMKPPSVRISHSVTSLAPGSTRTETKTKTVEKPIPPSCTNTTCQGPCSTARQIRPPAEGVPAQRGLTAPRPTGMRPPTGAIPRAPSQGPSIQAPQARQLSAPPTRQLQPPQARQLPAPQMRQMPAPQARQIPGPPGMQMAPPQARQIPGPPSRQLVPPQARQIPGPPAGQLAPPQLRQMQAPQIRTLQAPPQARQQPPTQMRQQTITPTGLRPPAHLIGAPVKTELRPSPPKPTPVLPAPAIMEGVSPQPSSMVPKEILEAPRKGGPVSRLPPLPTQLRPPPELMPPRTGLEQTVGRSLKERSLMYPGQKQVAKAQEFTKICRPQHIFTPAGKEEVIQKAVIEKRVERDETGETIVKTVAISDKDESGVMQKNTLSVQQFDPDYPKADGGREIVGVISTVSVSPSYKTVSQECVRVSLEPEINLSPQEVAQMVEEEKEDVENTLKMVPPDLELEPGSFEMKQRQQRLRLHSESMALLEQSIIQPAPTADEAQTEPSPEAMATMMHTVENGISPQAEPDQVFNTLFDEATNEQFVKVSSVTPGPLQDVVIPAEVPKEVHMEALSENMTQLTEKMNTRVSVEEAPYVDIFTRVMDQEQKLPKDLEHLVNVVGAEPAEVLDPYNLDELLESENPEEELSHGIDYFVQADPIQYVSRVQLRGTQMPAYFPGYMVALPDFPGLIKIARSPDEVYASAWKAVQPKYFDNESLINMSF